MVVSQNGYSANDRSLVSSRLVPGTQVRVTVRNGPAGDLLLYAAGRWDKEVENIDNTNSVFDDWGYAERTIRGSAALSNHASGTAIDLNATRHPLGKVGTFSGAQVKAIRRILADCGGAIRWGGDYLGRKDEMHLEVVADSKRCARVLLRLADSPAPPGSKYPTLQRGSTGKAVGVIQRFLSVTPVSEFFGPATEAAVKAYQKMRGLPTDGVVGPLTWRETGL